MVKTTVVSCWRTLVIELALLSSISLSFLRYYLHNGPFYRHIGRIKFTTNGRIVVEFNIYFVNCLSTRSRWLWWLRYIYPSNRHTLKYSFIIFVLHISTLFKYHKICCQLFNTFLYTKLQVFILVVWKSNKINIHLSIYNFVPTRTSVTIEIRPAVFVRVYTF